MFVNANSAPEDQEADQIFRTSLLVTMAASSALAFLAISTSYCCNTSFANQFFSYALVWVATVAMCIGTVTFYGVRGGGVETPDGDIKVSEMYLLSGVVLYGFSGLNVYLSAKYEQAAKDEAGGVDDDDSAVVEEEEIEVSVPGIAMTDLAKGGSKLL